MSIDGVAGDAERPVRTIYHASHGTLRVSRYTMSVRPQQSATNGPSRDMFGGPWLGVLVFVLIAVGLGWGMFQLFTSMTDQTRQTLDNALVDHGFDPDAVYTLKQDLVLGYLADGRIVLLPFKEQMPRDAPGRYTWPTAEEYAEDRDAYQKSRNLIGVAEAGTQVQFVEVIDDRDNQQTRILVMTRLMTGPHASRAPVLGMHLESADTESEQWRAVPRPDLFEIAESETGQIQSIVPAPTPNNE